MGILDELLAGGQRQKEYKDFVNRYEQGDPSEGYSDQEAASWDHDNGKRGGDAVTQEAWNLPRPKLCNWSRAVLSSPGLGYDDPQLTRFVNS
jgi:hypothetical protein